MSPIRITLRQARQAWFAHQRLASETGRPRSIAETIGDLGWIPMPSLATPYLALFSRGVIHRRSELDDKRVDAIVVPGPKGSSWMVPTADAPLVRAFAVADHASREARVATASVLTSSDLEGAREALREVLATPSTSDEIKMKLPERYLRSLGEIGRKSGISTLAALVMRNLWVTGEIMRVQGDGRLDALTVRWTIDPRPRTVPTAAEAVNMIAARWLAAHGPVTAKAFAAAFGIAAGRANAALKSANPVSVEIEDVPGEFLAPSDFVSPELHELPARFLPIRDPLTDIQLAGVASAEAARLAMTRSHGVGPTVMFNGELVATWLYDSTTGTLSWRVNTPNLPAETHNQIQLEANRVAAFIHGELGVAPLHMAVIPSRNRGATAASELAIEM